MTNPVQLQLRRDTAANIAAFVGAQGECLVDTDNNHIVVNDGATPNGWAAAKDAEVGLSGTLTGTAPSDGSSTPLPTASPGSIQSMRY